jgi:hypothetical protein
VRTPAVAAILLLSLSPALAAAGGDGPQGVFTLDRAASDDVGKAIDRSAADFNFLLRPFARSRLTKANPIPQRIEIVSTAAEVSVKIDQAAPVAAPRDGRTVKWTRDDGAVFDLTARTTDGALHQTFRGEDGRREAVFRLRPDGRLAMAVTISSPRLKKPLHYTLVFRRAGAP